MCRWLQLYLCETFLHYTHGIYSNQSLKRCSDPEPVHKAIEALMTSVCLARLSGHDTCLAPRIQACTQTVSLFSATCKWGLIVAAEVPVDMCGSSGSKFLRNSLLAPSISLLHMTTSAPPFQAHTRTRYTFCAGVEFLTCRRFCRAVKLARPLHGGVDCGFSHEVATRTVHVYEAPFRWPGN